jgi:hypothetical protein
LAVLSREGTLETEFLTECQMFSSCSFAFERNGRETTGFLQIDQQAKELRNICGAVLRLPRQCWPSVEFDLQDQMFVYHETIASWIALFDVLACPVINRFGLGWWLNDLTYPVRLCTSLARTVDLELCKFDESHFGGGRLWPTQRPDYKGVESIYRSGGHTISRVGL